MRNLFRFLLKYINFFLFLVLELVCLLMIIRYNNFQKVKFLNSSNQVTAGIFDSYSSVADYFSLRKTNKLLAEENARLRTMLQLQNSNKEEIKYTFFADSILSDNQFVTAKVINNSVNKQHNYLTLNKGSLDGVKPDMGIVGANGVVGRINHVSKHYSTAISLLNGRWSISAKLKRTNDNGTIVWNGKDHQKVLLEGIPYNVELTKGDTIVTSGYSSVFPDGVPIGVVSEVELDKGSNFYLINVDLFLDFNRLSYVNIVMNRNRDELNELEEQLNND
ncbi:rod shape-determining protein MreC [Prolixibacteraceae bacterium JC049]|nr:rod shape-determining protein MreC [Prolixibacteraceae bacterium JC049]